MTNHLRAIDIKEYAKALDVAKEFADRAEKTEAAVRRVRELHTSEAPDGYEYEFDITVRGGHWVQCDCCDSAHCCDKAVRTCLACGDDMPCPTLRVLNGDSDE